MAASLLLPLLLLLPADVEPAVGGDRHVAGSAGPSEVARSMHAANEDKHRLISRNRIGQEPEAGGGGRAPRLRRRRQDQAIPPWPASTVTPAPSPPIGRLAESSTEVCSASFDVAAHDAAPLELYIVVDMTPSLRFVFAQVKAFLAGLVQRLPDTARLQIQLVTVESIMSNPVQRATGRAAVINAINAMAHNNLDATSIGRALLMLGEGRASTSSTPPVYVNRNPQTPPNSTLN